MRRPPPGLTVSVSTQGETFQAFLPSPLPPVPAIDWSAALIRQFDDALVALGRLDSRSPPRRCFVPHWPMCSSKPSTRFWTATAGSAGC